VTETHRVPTRVAYYTFLPYSADMVRAAEFTWSPESRVSLIVFHKNASDLARQYYKRGVPSEVEDRLVSRKEGAAFMLALVEPSQSSYNRFVDESDGPG
jgi:hypothetical protein